MAEPDVEAAWRAEFKRIGETRLRDALNSGSGITDEPKRQAAFRWLGDEAEARRLREEQTHHYVRRHDSATRLIAVVASRPHGRERATGPQAVHRKPCTQWGHLKWTVAVLTMICPPARTYPMLSIFQRQRQLIQ